MSEELNKIVKIFILALTFGLIIGFQFDSAVHHSFGESRLLYVFLRLNSCNVNRSTIGYSIPLGSDIRRK